jgi:uncharacterized protein with HEPN domain
MSPKTLRTPDYIDHMLHGIGRVRDYTTGMTMDDFLGRPMTQDAVIRNIEMIGEAARNIARDDPGFAAAHPEIPWTEIYLMRNRLTHGYFSVDLQIVWKVVERDLPDLEAQLRGLRPVDS